MSCAGSHTVAKANLGDKAGLLAAVALMMDYTLNVVVGISAGALIFCTSAARAGEKSGAVFVAKFCGPAAPLRASVYASDDPDKR